MKYAKQYAKTIGLAATLAVALGGCATTSGGPGLNNQQRGAVEHGAIVGGAMGCGLGIVGALFHGGNAGTLIKGCAIGGAIGATAGGVIAYHDQLAQAQALAAQAQQAGAVAQIQTRTVQTTGTNGQPTTARALGSLHLALNAQDVAIHGSATTALLARVANLAAASKTPVHIVVSGPMTARNWIAQTILVDLGNNPGQVSVSEQYAAQPGLVLTPVPAVSARN